MAVPTVDEMRVYGCSLKRLSDNVKGLANGMRLGADVQRALEKLTTHIDRYPLPTNTRYCLSQSPTDENIWHILEHTGRHWEEVRLHYAPGEPPIEFTSREEALDHIRLLRGD